MKAKPLSDDLFERMLALIEAGDLPPGAVVNEAVLAQRFGVSRGPVREAVRRLQGIRLVSREPYLKARVVSLSAAAVLDLFEVRGALESLACRRAAERMDEAALAALMADFEASRQPGAPAFDFHHRIVEAGGNSRIADALGGDLYHLLRIYRRRSGAVPERHDQAYGEHWQILRAIRARDGELAASLMAAHVTRAARHLVGGLVGDGPVAGEPDAASSAGPSLISPSSISPSSISPVPPDVAGRISA